MNTNIKTGFVCNKTCRCEDCTSMECASSPDFCNKACRCQDCATQDCIYKSEKNNE